MPSHAQRNVTLAEALYDYREARAPRYVESTWKAHDTTLERFRKWAVRPSELGPNCLLYDIDERTMTRYFARLRPPYLSASTHNNYRLSLMLFFKFCVEEAWIDRNPMRHVDPAPVRRRPRLQLSAQELLQALEDASPRDRIALAVGMYTGLRANDITALKVGDVNLSNNVIHAVIKKTKSYDDIQFGSELREELIRWFNHYAQVMGLADWQNDLPNDWTLIPPMQFQATNVWKPEAGGQTVYKTGKTYSHPEQIVHRALVRLGHPTRGEGFHTLRRSTARSFYELAKSKGVRDPIRMSQALLGHKNQQTTELYLGLTADKVRRDELLRGSFLRQVADDEVAAARGDSQDEGGTAGGLAVAK